jgi:hypothetical protein
MTGRTRARALAALGLVVVAGFAAVDLGAQAAPAATALPTAEEIFAAYREALGGEAAIRQHTSRTVKGLFEIPAQGIQGAISIYAAAPDLMRLSVNLPGLGEMQRGYDGTVGWSIDPAVGPRVLDGRELDELKHSSDFYEDLHDTAKFSSVTVVGRVPFEGRDCYEVTIERESGFEFTEFFDASSGLLAGVKMEAASQMGTIPVTTVVSDYKEFGGLLTPTVSVQKMMGLESKTTITSVTYEPVGPETFALPAEIAALVAAK